mgnify:FL=1
MFRNDATIVTEFNFACKKYLANASIAGQQTTVGVVTKPLNGYVVFMLEYVDFCIDQDIKNDELGPILDYTITYS